MKLTIITSTYNCKYDVRITADSIVAQELDSIQWIVVDGDSNDGTISELKKYKKYISKLISEPDSGIYDAWNKALPYIEGQWVLFLGAGDSIQKGALNSIMYELSNCVDEYDIMYCNVELVNRDDKVLKQYRDIDTNTFDTCRPKLPCHQGVLHNAKVFRNNNIFDTSYKVAADGKLLLQIINDNGKVLYINKTLSKMLFGGVSSSWDNVLCVYNELLRCSNELNIKIPFSHRIYTLFRVYIKYFLYKVRNSL